MSVPAKPAQGLTAEQRDYALNAAMYHLIQAGMWDELARLFASAGFVTERARRSGFADVYNDALAASRADGLSPDGRRLSAPGSIFCVAG